MNTAQHRATFQSPYVLGATRYQMRKGPRLGDCLLCVADAGHREFFAETKKNEFAVIDVLTRQKAWFERPPNADEDAIEALIESHFGVRAFRADTRLWLV